MKGTRGTFKKVLLGILAGVFAFSMMVGCSAPAAEKTEGTDTPAGEVAAPAKDPIIVKVAARNDFQEVWDQVNKVLEPEGIKVDNRAYDTSVNINDLLVAGDIDLNVAQHGVALAYFKSSDEKFKDLVSLGELHIATLDLYSNKYKSLDELPQGATIAIPNDFMNGGRALIILSKSGAITLKPDAGPLPTVDDIAENPKGFVFQDISSDIMIRILDDVDAGFSYSINAVDAGLDPQTDPIYKSGIDFALNPTEAQFVIVVTARGEDANNEVYKKIVEAYHDPSVQKVYKEVYGNSLVPVVDGKAVDLSKL
jgi:D-methionine transport system substrate-binding protein